MLFWLPNLITLCALFFGFQCIVNVMLGDFEKANFFILLAVVADFLDGRVARLLGVQSEFGASFDSVSDTISFALAPALLIHQSILFDLYSYSYKPFASWAIAFTYLGCGAFRLARFTVDTQVDKRFFQGLPSPLAAMMIVAFVGISNQYQFSQSLLLMLGIGITIILGFLMVSKIPFYSFKDMRLAKKIKFGSYLFLLVLLVILAQFIYEYAFYECLILICLTYILSPLYGYLRRWMRLLFDSF